MSPQFVDFDADGNTDIITATYEGHAFIVRGSASGWQQPQHLVDAQGRNIVLSFYYDTERRTFDNADRSPQGTSNPPDQCVSAVAFDWDNDGDLDLLLGAYQGRLYLQRNEGKPGSPSFTGVNEPLQAGGEPFMVEGGLTAPRLVDWDDDGLTDLVCGGFKGGVYLYRNSGTRDAPSFEAPQTLIKADKEPLQGPTRPNSGLYADPVDYDDDGDLDLLVGGYAQWEPKARELTNDQRDRLAKLDEQFEEIQSKVQAMYTEAQDRAQDAQTDAQREAIMTELTAREDYAAGVKKWGEVYTEISKLRGESQREAGIWLYERDESSPIGR